MNLPYFKKLLRNSRRAFTLLEILASLAIVTMVLLGPLSNAINSAAFARQTKDVITGTYLAQEALELLHYQYDSLYLQCVNRVEACSDVAYPTLGNETQSEKAWRLFKERLAGGGTSCFDSDGCSYDFLDMLNATSTTAPATYSPTGSECPNLSLVNSTVLGFDSHVRNYYVCSGIDPGRFGDNVFSVKRTAYSRTVTVQSVDTFEGSNPQPHYYDDLFIIATVNYRGSNGTLRSVKIKDFFHIRS